MSGVLGSIISCQCKTFATLQSCSIEHTPQFQDTQDRVMCCHCRVMKDILLYSPFETETTVYVNLPTYLNTQVNHYSLVFWYK